MSKLYAPLKMLKMIYDNTDGRPPFEAHKAMLRILASRRKIPFRDYTEEEFINYLSSPMMGMPLDDSSRRKFSEFYVDPEKFERDFKVAQKFKYFPVILEELFNVDPDWRKRIIKGDFYSEIRDEFLYPTYLGVWARNKQVFKPDIDFARMLLDTEITHTLDNGEEKTEPGCYITRDQMEHLPCNNLYIDLSDCSELFGKIKGFFIFVDSSYYGIDTSSYVLIDSNDEDPSNGLVFFSHYSGGTYGDDGIVIMSESQMGAKLAEYNGDMQISSEDAPVDRRRACIFVMQILTYISSKEPDILESPLTSGTYKKPSKKAVPKNDISEVQIWEVGVKYGAAWRYAKKERDGEGGSGRNTSGTRRPPLPYYRRAHWQRYWTGKGRTTCTVKWISPIFVMGQSHVDLSQTDVKIHKMSGDTNE